MCLNSLKLIFRIDFIVLYLKAVERLKNYKGKPAFENAKEIIAVAEDAFNKLDEKLQESFKIKRPFFDHA